MMIKFPTHIIDFIISSYLKLYGLKFSREDHVRFVKTLLDVISIPNLEPSKLNKCCICLIQLLK